MFGQCTVNLLSNLTDLYKKNPSQTSFSSNVSCLTCLNRPSAVFWAYFKNWNTKIMYQKLAKLA